ncbi:MAG: fimbrillin family protein [Rikenellaceae bacterium]
MNKIVTTIFKMFLLVSVVSLAAPSCTSHEETDDANELPTPNDDDDDNSGNPTPTVNDVTFLSAITTRVANDNKFMDAEQIYVQSYTSEGGKGVGATYSYNATDAIFSAEEPITLTDDESLSYIALFPSGEYSNLTSSFAFDVESDQSQYANYNNSSLMVASAELTDSEKPTLNFVKALSNIVFTISNEDIDCADLDVSVRLRVTATADISNDSYAYSGSLSYITPYRSGNSFYVIAPPQAIVDSQLAIKITYDGDSYSWYYGSARELVSGYRYDYTLTLDTVSTSLAVVYNGETTDWSTRSDGYELETPEPEPEEPEEPEADNDILSFDDAPEPNTTVKTIYEPSSLDTYYYPITVYGNSSTSSYASPSTARTATRILPHMPDFTPDYSLSNYKAKVNKYGSAINGTKFTATGRFHTEKDANGRWWIVDPEGYRHIQRGTTSINTSNATVSYLTKWGTIQSWLGSLRSDFDELGFNATGAFSSDTYQELQTYGSTNPNTPFTIAPSFGLLSSFRKSSYVTDKQYPDGSTDNDDLEAGLPYYDGWEAYCKEYIQSEIAIYENDVNVLGFFSDNELKWNGASLNILDEFLDLTDTTNPAYLAAKEFMTRNGASTPTSDLREAFAGEAAAKYYSGVRKALDDLGYKILYLGTRLHGTPKQIHAVIEAAAESCDIISINYYGNWSVANQGSYSAQGVSSFVYNSWEQVDAPFMVTEFYVKATDSGLPNSDGAGWLVATQLDRACWYQHFTLGLLESTHCVGWHWFRYMDDDEANKGIYNSKFEQYETLTRWMKGINYNTYELIDFFDSYRF